MKFLQHNSEHLRRYLERGGYAELAGQPSFELDLTAYERALEEVKRQHASLGPEEAAARAAYRLLAKPKKAVASGEWRAGNGERQSAPGILAAKFSAWMRRERKWRWAVVAWAVAVLLLLAAIAAKAEPAKTVASSEWRANLRHAAVRASLPPQFDAPIIFLSNGGTQLAVVPAGKLILNCSTNMSCTWNSSTRQFDMTASTTAGSAWSSLTAPTANLSMSHGAFTSTFTWSAATGAGDLFSLADSASNTGTGHVLRVNTGASSAAKPVRFTAGGTANGVEMSTTGVLAAIGTGGINATQYKGGTASGTGACGASTWASTLNDAAAPTCTQPAFSNLSGTATKTQLPATTVSTDQTNTYSTGTQDFESAAVTRPFRRLAFASFPATCTANREFLERSDPAAAGQVVYVCNSTGNGWDLVGDGGGGGGGVPNPGANGMVACTGTNCSTSAARTITGTTGNITVTNGDGGAGNPTIDLGSTAVQTDQANTWTTGAQDMGAAASLVVPKAAGAAPTAQGDVRYDTTQAQLVTGDTGSITVGIPRVLKATNCTAEGNCTSASGGNQVDAGGAQGTTETNFASNFSVPANYLTANKLIVVFAAFDVDGTGGGPTLQLRLKAGSTVLVSGTASSVGANTARGFGLTYLVQGTAAPGAAVNVESMVATRGWGTAGDISAVNTTAQPVAVATNAAFTLQLSAQWSAATAGNKVRLRQFVVLGAN